jgi:hypothetical protein
MMTLEKDVMNDEAKAGIQSTTPASQDGHPSISGYSPANPGSSPRSALTSSSLAQPQCFFSLQRCMRVVEVQARSVVLWMPAFAGMTKRL